MKGYRDAMDQRPRRAELNGTASDNSVRGVAETVRDESMRFYIHISSRNLLRGNGRGYVDRKARGVPSVKREVSSSRLPIERGEESEV
jgi:hypothetical protein